MAEEKKNTNFDAVAYKKALRELLREYKPKKEIRYDELTDKMVTPFHLDAEQMDNLIVRVEDAGISVVDENGDPSELSLKKASHEEKELAKSDLSAPSGVKINDPVRM